MPLSTRNMRREPPRPSHPSRPARAPVNRANAARSAGPHTDVGKSTSVANALTHGLTGQRALLPGQDVCELTLHDTAFRSAIGPRCAIEQLLVDDLVATTWRILSRYGVRPLEPSEGPEPRQC